MGKISTYAINTTPSPLDYLLGDTTATTTTNRFKIQDMLKLAQTDYLYNPSKWYIYRNSAYNMPNTFGVLPCDSLLFDTSSNADTTANKGRVTITVAGYYRLSGGINFNLDANARHNLILFFKNGSELVRGQELESPGGATSRNVGIVVSPPLVLLAAGDYIELVVYDSGGGGRPVNTGPNVAFFGGEFVCKA